MSSTMTIRRASCIAIIAGCCAGAEAQFAGFGTPVSLPDSEVLIDLEFVDLDLDGDLDIVCTRLGSPFGTVGIWLNDGAGVFSGPTLQGVGASPQHIASGRLDADADFDLVVSNRDSNDISVLRSNADGTLQPETILSGGVEPMKIAIDDFDRDGNQDIAVVNLGDNDVRVFYGDGSGTVFPTVTDFSTLNLGGSTGLGARAIVSAHLNRDGAPDLVSANTLSDNLTVLYNTGSGGFFTGEFALFVSTGDSPLDLVAGDWNRDGAIDLAVALGGSSNSVQVFLSDAVAPFPDFALGQTVPINGRPVGLAAGDLDCDGDLDLVSMNEATNTYTVLLNDGAGVFTPSTGPAGSSPNKPRLGDIDCDGDLDLAVANLNGFDMSVYRNGTNILLLCPGDLTGDGNVDGADLGLLLGAWGMCP